MNRRRLLGALAAGALGSVAGCNSPSADASDRTATGQPTSTGERTSGRPPADPISLPVPEEDLVRAAPKDAIPAITDPVFGEDWSGIEYDVEHEQGTYTHTPRLEFEDEVLGVVRDGQVRAYPLRLLDWHEVVNDEFGAPVLVTYCPVCNSGLVADRRVDGEAAQFGVSGYLYRANLVMYEDRTDSLWSQLLATAIRGDATGTELAQYPSTLTTWGRWAGAHDDTEVLLPPPVSDTVLGDVRFNYNLDIYGRKEDIAERYPGTGPLGEQEWRDNRLQRRAVVLGVAADGEAVAYPLREVNAHGPIEDEVGGRPVVVARAPDDTLVSYDRRLDGETLSFSEGEDWHLRAGGSRFRAIDGVAVDGPYEGRRLTAIEGATQLFWAAWLKFHPETTVYGIDR